MVDESSIPEEALEYDNHYYCLFENICTTWEEASEYCISLAGYLATINDENENVVLYDWVNGSEYKNVYFGFTDSIEEGKWQWINGKSSIFTNWSSGEPNNERNTENYALFYYKYSKYKWNHGNFGNGTVNDDKVFICEWGS